MSYTQFTIPNGVSVTSGFAAENSGAAARLWMELLIPTTARVLARYDHPVWGRYAAVTENDYGKGLATYVGFFPSDGLMARILADAVRKAGLWSADQEIGFPLVTKSGTNPQGETVRYYVNYSARAVSFRYPHRTGIDLLSNRAVDQGAPQELPPWGATIILEK